MTPQQNIRTFYTLMLTQAFSLIGSYMTKVALGVWIFAETGNATPLALVSFFAFIPRIIAASIAGVLADRWDRRYVMAIADAGQAAGTILLLISIGTGRFELWHLYAVSLIQAAFDIFQYPAFTASVTMLVPDHHRDRANAIQYFVGPASGVIAPTLALFLYGIIGVLGVITIDLVTFVVAFAVVLLVKIPRPPVSEEGKKNKGSVWFEAWSGMRFLWTRRPLFWLFLYISLVNVLLACTFVLNTPYLLLRFDNQALVGPVISTLAGATLLGSIWMMIKGGTRPRINGIIIGILLSGTGMIFYGMSRELLPMLLAAFLVSISPSITSASSVAILQSKTPPDMQGRVFAAMAQLAMIFMPFAYLAMGPLADLVFEPAVGQGSWSLIAPFFGGGAGAGIGLLMAISGTLLVGMTILVYAVPSIRHMEANLPDSVRKAPPPQPEVETLPQNEPALEGVPGA